MRLRARLADGRRGIVFDALLVAWIVLGDALAVRSGVYSSAVRPRRSGSRSSSRARRCRASRACRSSEIAPIVAVYVPLRVGAVRDGQRLRRLVAARGREPAVRRLLADRALLSLPVERPLELGRTRARAARTRTGSP